MRITLRIIDSLSQWTGSSARWFCLALVLVGAYDVTLRYVFNAPTVWGYETMVMLGGGTYALGWTYSHLHKSHVRVDVFYVRLSPRGQAFIDIIGALIFFFPLMAVLIKTSIAWTWTAWVRHEVMIESYWYPPAAPFRTVIALGICLFTLQGLAQFIRDSYFLVRRKALD